MEPVSTALAGIALVQQSVEFIKRNINTVQDIRQIFDMVDNALDGQQQINKDRWGNKNMIGQHKSAAHAVIDAKLAGEQIEEMKNLIDMRFGFGTWQEILKLRADRIREEQEEEVAGWYRDTKGQKVEYNVYKKQDFCREFPDEEVCKIDE